MNIKIAPIRYKIPALSLPHVYLFLYFPSQYILLHVYLLLYSLSLHELSILCSYFCFVYGLRSSSRLPDTSTKRPLMKEQIVDCGEETQQTDGGYSRMKTKIETKSSQKNRKEKD
ncbi:hypothetical protein CMV_002697 [Castanea mollissima]|uniref:Uncharacterized protein n=1 Tax=Castanea mollissima TaxID=60419 RepID=A0A8J4W5R3_9ROSI|nr:hypothetical protein CMV_002697 [Castanea mollissima]